MKWAWTVGAIALVAVLAIAIGASPADSQEIAGVRFTWEINFTTVIVVIGAAFGWWFTVVRQGDKVTAHAATIAELKLELAKKVEEVALQKVQSDIEIMNINMAKLDHQHQALKDEVYKDYLNAKAVREIKQEIREDVEGAEERMMAAIQDLSKRFDNFAQQKPRA